MNKTLALLITLIFTAAVASAQEQEPKESTQQEHSAQESKPQDSLAPMRFGVRAGINSSSFAYPYSRSVIGFHVGGAAEIELTKINTDWKNFTVALHPTLLFSQKGGRYGTYLIYASELKAYYLEAIVPCSFKLPINEKFSIRVELGPYLAFGLFGEESYYNRSSFDRLSHMDLGVNYGVAIDFFNNFYFGTNYGVGFTSDKVSVAYFTFGYNF